MGRANRRKRRGRTARTAPVPPPPRSPNSSHSGQLSASPETFGRRRTLAGVALGLLVVGSYVPAFFAGFVWDDRIFTEAPAVRDWAGLGRIWFSPAEIRNEAHYWPLVYTTFWLEHKLWGFAPAGYHVVNVLLHLVNTLLLWRLGVRLTLPGAWLVGAVFAVHPLHVESVAWIMERKDVLSGLCYLAAFAAWVRYAEAPDARGRTRRYCLALVLFGLGLLSKSIVVTLPAALLLWLWWQRGRAPGEGEREGAPFAGIAGVDLFRLVPFFAVGVAAAVADVLFSASREPLSFDYSMGERTLIAARALWFYAGKLLWPTDLAVIYPRWEVGAADPWAWGSLVAAAVLAAGLWLLRQRVGRGPLAGALFFAVTLSPVLGFVDFGYMQFSFVADRYQYLAGIGLIAVVVGAAAHGAARLPRAWRYAAAGGAAVALVVLGTLTWRQAGIYRDGETLFRHVIAHNPTAREAHLNLGEALTKAGRWDEALAAFRIAVEHAPDDARGHTNVGATLIMLDRLDEAEPPLRRALERDPDSVHALQNLAAAEVMWKRYGAALALYRRLVQVDPRSPSAHHGVGTALYHLGRPDEALASLERALTLDPTRADIRTNRDEVRALLRRGG